MNYKQIGFNPKEFKRTWTTFVGDFGVFAHIGAKILETQRFGRRSNLADLLFFANGDHFLEELILRKG